MPRDTEIRQVLPLTGQRRCEKEEPMERLLMLMQAENFKEAREPMESALRMASVPSKLTIGLSLAEEPDDEDQAVMRTLQGVMYLAASRDVWDTASKFWQGEAYMLMVTSSAVFSPSWDRQLEQLLLACTPHSVLTGILPWPGSAVDAVCSICATSLEGRTLHLSSGIPMRYADHSHMTPFLNPSFAFAPSAFFLTLKTGPETEPCALQAFRERWTLYTAQLPVLRSKEPTQIQPLLLPQSETAENFAVHFGIDLEAGTLSPEIREGIFTSDLQVTGTVPLSVKVQEGVRRRLMSRWALDPVVVTAFLPDNPAEVPDDLQMARFRRLRDIEKLPLLCFARGEALRKILITHPNTLEFRSRYALDLMGNGADDRERYEVLNRFFLLSAGREKADAHTHCVWMDFDYLRYPVYEGIALNWSSICTEKVCLAKVQGHLDFSMISVPSGQVVSLCRELHSLCETSLRQTGCLPDPEKAIFSLVETTPNRFDFPELPGACELLTLSTTMNGEDWGRKGGS